MKILRNLYSKIEIGKVAELFNAQAGDCTSNNQLLNLRSALKDGVNLCITVASPYRLGFHDFYCVKVTQTVSEPFVSSRKSADYSAGTNQLTD